MKHSIADTPPCPRTHSARASFSLALALLVAACGGGAGGNSPGNTAPGQPPPTNSISGTVTLRGVPLPGATVTAYSTNTNTVTGTTTTDANGNYSFSGLEATSDVTANFQFWPTLAGHSFYPAVGKTLASRAGYQFNPVPQNWYVPVGLSSTRAGYNGAFSNPNGGSGMILDVVNLMSALTGTTNGSVTGADFVAYDGTNPLVVLAQTGQRTSYVAGDDGALASGAAWPSGRYTDNADGTVTDSLTGLIWLKDAGCLASAVWATAVAEVNGLASGACGLSDGSMAGDWRLPNIVEFESVIDASASSPALTPGHPFTNVTADIYWSSTVYYGGQEGTTNAWAVGLSDGRYVNDGTSNAMLTARNGVWAVKGGGGGVVSLQATGAYVPFASGDDGSYEYGAPLPAPRMIDNGNGTVTDSVTGLVWLKQANCISQPWAAAVAAVQALASGECGLSDGSHAGDWRMPNRKELESLADRAQNNQADYFDETFTSKTPGVSTQAAAFSNFVGFQYYWTSTTDAANVNAAWTVFSCDFGVYATDKTTSGYTLAVRGP